MAGVTISYKGSQIASMTSAGTKTLTTSGKYCEDNITVGYSAPSLQSVSINTQYLPSQNTTIENGFIGTQQWFEKTNTLSNEKSYAYSTVRSNLKQVYFCDFKTNTSYNIIGEVNLKWANNDIETYSINTNIDITNLGDYITVPFTWTGIGRTQTFYRIQILLSQQQYLGIYFTSENYINDTVTFQETSYLSLYENNCDGYSSINLNLMDNPLYLNIYKSLAYRSVISALAQGVSEWANSLSVVTEQQFAGQPFSGSFVFNNVKTINTYGFGSAYTNIDGAGTAGGWNGSFPSCSLVSNGAFVRNRGLIGVNFPSCTIISNYAFSGCTYLTSVSFPVCTIIGSSAFQGCYKLQTIEFPSCTIIGSSAFQGCYKLQTIEFPSCTTISSNAFSGCTSLTTVNFPLCTTIESCAFWNCSALSSISFPICTTINTSAFRSCSNLTTISFPVCTSIGNYAFSGCSKLSQAYFMGSSIVSIGTNIFYQTPMSTSTYLGYFGSIYVPSSLLNSYKTATNWTQYSSRMVGI